MNSTITDIMNRYSCRRYKDEALDENVLKAIIEAGRVAPCGGNNQTNKFYVVKSKDILNKLIATAEQEFAAMELTEDLYKSLIPCAFSVSITSFFPSSVTSTLKP